MKRINITCPACGSRAYLRPASVVYGDKAPDPDAKYYVCGRYPACDCYVAAHRKTMLPMGTLADKALRKKRHDAHVALDSLWKNGIMSRKEAYRLLQLSMGLPAEDAHMMWRISALPKVNREICCKTCGMWRTAWRSSMRSISRRSRLPKSGNPGSGAGSRRSGS